MDTKNSWLSIGKLDESLVDKQEAGKRTVSFSPEDEHAYSDDYAPKDWYTVYIKNGVRYVPHYDNMRYYVGPGFPRQTKAVYTPEMLLKSGAKISRAYLFVRESSKELHQIVEEAARIK